MAKPEPNRWNQPKSKIQQLLTKAFPEHRTQDYDVFNVTWLAKKLKMSREGIYKWFREDRIPYKRAVDITEIRGCRIKLKELLPYVA